MLDVHHVREDFPMLKKIMNGRHLIYLDTGATSLKPQCVIDTMHRFYSQEYGTVHRSIYELAAHSTEKYSQARTKVQQFLGAKEDSEIIFTRGTTDSINLVARSLGQTFLKEGDEVIISEMEHHSNIVPWQMLVQEKGIQLKFIPMTLEGELYIDVFKELLSEKTKLVSIAHVANATGTINPVEEIIALAHQQGAKVLLDGAQAASHLSVNVQALDVDFYAFSGHKLYGPTGIGVLYGKEELLREMPPVQGGGDMIETVTMEKQPTKSLHSALKRNPSIVEVIGLGAAIDYVESIGRPQIEAHLKELTTYATQKLIEIPHLKVIGTAKNKGPLISFVMDDLHPLDLGTLLGLKGIAIRTGHLCAQPTLARFGLTALARLSFGMYNTLGDIDHAVSAIQEGALLLKPELSY